MTDFEFVSRYGVLGMSTPDFGSMCPGQCEGIGYYPVHRDETLTGAERAAWDAAEAAAPSDDGYHFIKCGDCGGTGKAGEPNDG